MLSVEEIAVIIMFMLYCNIVADLKNRYMNALISLLILNALNFEDLAKSKLLSIIQIMTVKKELHK